MVNSRRIITLSVGLVLLFVAGAMPAAADGGDVGICVIGVDSPCNGVDDNTTTEPPSDPAEPIQYAPGGLPYASGPADEPVEPVKEPRHAPENNSLETDDREVSPGLPLADGECVPGPSTMCAPPNGGTPVDGDTIQCIRAPCEPPRGTEYCIDADNAVMRCEMFPEDAETEPYDRLVPVHFSEGKPVYAMPDTDSERPMIDTGSERPMVDEHAHEPTEDKRVRTSPVGLLRAVLSGLFDWF